jgi:hypothetical protein
LKRVASIAATVTTCKQQKSSSKCIANSSSSSSSSSSSDYRQKGCEQLRDTVEVEHSKPASQHEDDNLNNQGFPPNLLQTLKCFSANAANMDYLIHKMTAAAAMISYKHRETVKITSRIVYME